MNRTRALNGPIALLMLLSRMALLSLCIYAATPFSINPKQLEMPTEYTHIKWLYFTHISLYHTILTSSLLIISRIKRRLFDEESNASDHSPSKRTSPAGPLDSLISMCLCTSMLFNFITTGVFWSLYFIYREAIVHKKYLVPGYETYLLTELSLHLFPLCLSFLEQLTLPLKKSVYHLLFTEAFVVLWATAIHIAKIGRKRYLYGFLSISLAGRITFFAVIALVCPALYHVIHMINRATCLHKLR